MSDMTLIADETFQLLRGWLNLKALWNMLRMSVTAETSQSEMSPLKVEAPKNMEGTSVTAETFQLLRGWLNSEACKNM